MMMFCGCDSDSDFGSDFQSDFESDSEPDSQLLVEIYQSRWMGYRKFFLTLILTTLRRVEGEYQYYYCTSTVQVLYKYRPQPGVQYWYTGLAVSTARYRQAHCSPVYYRRLHSEYVRMLP